jgi:hypothetical protein
MPVTSALLPCHSHTEQSVELHLDPTAAALSPPHKGHKDNPRLPIQLHSDNLYSALLIVVHMESFYVASLAPKLIRLQPPLPQFKECYGTNDSPLRPATVAFSVTS